MQQDFQPLVRTLLRQCTDHFGNRLIAAYLHGSIEQGDAIEGVSDLDAFLVISQRDDDETRLERLRLQLEEEYPVVSGVHLVVMTKDELAEDRFARFALRYHASLYADEDIAVKIDQIDQERYRPDKALAKSRMTFARRCFDEALMGMTPDCTGELPADPFYTARKFARYFVIIEGAYSLMAYNAFESFDCMNVLDRLIALAPEHNEALLLTKTVLEDPKKAGVTDRRYLCEIKRFVYWMFDEIQRV